MRLVLVVNPFATRVNEERLARVRKELQRAGDVEVVLTEGPGHATELVVEAVRGGADAVVVFSGDGGFNEALNGLQSDVPIGFLPGRRD
jgi:Sphingosine kinase and enzymes related to eukaryotic diacylglycerol kinase